MIVKEILVWMVVAILLVILVSIGKHNLETSLWLTLSIILLITYIIGFFTRLILLIKNLKKK